MQNLIGQIINGWRVLKRNKESKSTHLTWIMECPNCKKEVATSVFKCKHHKRCRYCFSKHKIRNLTSKVFGRLLVLERDHNKLDRIYWNCLCYGCNNIISVSTNSLTTGNTTSCRKCSLYKGYRDISMTFFNNIKRNAKRRRRYTSKDIYFDLEIKYLWDLYLKQDKRCKISGRGLTFPKNGRDSNYTASLDRIDSTKPYIIDNVQWVHKDINKMKQNFSDEYFIKTCREIVNYNLNY